MKSAAAKSKIFIAIILISISLMSVSCSQPNEDITDPTTDIHTHRYEITEMKTPTCTEDGYVKKKCACGEETEEILSKLGHEFTEYKYNDDGTCTENGTETAKCNRCEEKDTREKEGTKTEHSYTEYKYNNDATCTENGTETAKCDHCDSTDTREKEGSKTDHEIEYHDGKEATCEENGWKAYETCKNCEYTTYEEIPSTGHQYNGMICIKCKGEDREGKINALMIENDTIVTGYNDTVSKDITEIEIPEGIEEIKETAFMGYINVVKVILPSTLKRIGSGVFQNCVSLKEIAIPHGVEEIGDMLFAECGQEMTVYYDGTEDEWERISKDETLWSYDNEITMVFKSA